MKNNNSIWHNRLIPIVFSAMIISFWFGYRGKPSSEVFVHYPVMRLLNYNSIRLLIFTVLGFTMAWALFSCGVRGKSLLLRALLSNVIFTVSYGIWHFYNQRRKIYWANEWMIFWGTLLGAGLFLIVCKRLYGKDRIQSREDDECKLDLISVYREPLMGAAILYVMIFHTESMGASYPGLVHAAVSMGNIGVDMFLFLSGIGMTYSLNRNFDIGIFYKKRLLRIYPTYIPWAVGYTLVCIVEGLCGVSMLLWNCLGIGFWVTENPCAFNWYISAILLLYLLTPVLYSFLKNPDKRTRNSVILFSSSLFLLLLISKWKLARLLIACCRIPVFIVGMLIGFWILDKKGISKSEDKSLVFLFLITLFVFAVKSITDIPVVGWHWLLYAAAAPILCKFLAELFQRLPEAFPVMGLLRWAGKNSFPLYLINVVSVRLSRIYMDPIIRGNRAFGMVWCIFVLIADLYIIYFYERNRKAGACGFSKK